MNDKKLTRTSEMGLKALERVDNVLNFADSKVGFLIAFISLLIGLLVDQFSLIKQLLLSQNHLYATLIGIAIFLMSSGLILILVSSMQIVFPRLKITTIQSFFFFGSIYKLKDVEFISAYKELSQDELTDHILSQLHAVSVIANQKFVNVQWAMSGAVVVFIGWLMAILVLFLAG